MSFELVVVGGGNMGAALLGGMIDAGTAIPTTTAIVEPLEARRDELTRQFPDVTVVAEMPRCVSAILAVKPPDIPAVAAAAASAGARRVLSVAAGVPTRTIVAATGPDVAVLRTMPNTPALVRQGVSALCGAEGTSDHDLDWAEAALRGVGLVVRVAESQLDAVTGLTGSGPAYVFLVAEALIDAGVAAGLPRDTAATMVAQLLVGSAALLAARGDPAGLRAMVTSPGGTTAVGVQVLEERSVPSALVDAVLAAAQRSRELGAG